MLLQEMLRVLEQDYPCHYALDWDNVGLLVGRDDKDIKKVYVALDATDDIISKAVAYGADLILTHHPLIYTPLKHVNNQDFIGSRILRMIQSDISCYAMHTNYDVLAMSELAAAYLSLNECKVLLLTKEEDGGKAAQGIGRVGEAHKTQTLKEYCEHVKHCFGLKEVKVFGELEKIVKCVAVSPGSGSRMIEDAIRMGADVLVTGDIDHHTGIDANARGLNIIDAGHYGIEHIFTTDMRKYLSRMFPEISVMEALVEHPFLMI